MNCPNCRSGGAYMGFITVECLNDRCRYFCKRLYDEWWAKIEEEERVEEAAMIHRLESNVVTVDLGATPSRLIAPGPISNVLESIQQLVKALEAGSYNAKPLHESERTHPNQLCWGGTDPLYKGVGLKVESLEAVMQNVTFDESHINFSLTFDVARHHDLLLND